MPEGLVLAAVTLLLLAGLAGRVPTLAVVALAGAAGSALAGTRLSRLAAGVAPAAGPAPVRSRSARRRATSPARVAVLLDAAVVTAGLTAAGLPLVDPAQRPAAALAGLAGTTALFAAGLPRAEPGPRPPARVRLRRALDVTAAGLGLVLAGWLLLPRDRLDPPGRLAVAVAVAGLAIGVLTALTGRRRRAGVARCRAGAALALLGLVLLVAFPTEAARDRQVLLAVPPLVGGVLLTAAGARRVARAEPDPPEAPPRVWPRAVVPAGAAVAATGWQLHTGGPPDATAVLLALAVAPPLVLRDLLRAGDPAAPAAPDAPPPARHRTAGPGSTTVPAGAVAAASAAASPPDPAGWADPERTAGPDA
ncbi:GGDEF domain-containing protein, partial [Micromonospora sp. CPCC 205561]